MRAHYSAPIQSVAGALQTGATVSVFVNGSTANGTQLGTLIPGTLYADGSSGTTLTNPFIAVGGTISFYLAYPIRVDLGIQVPGQAQVYFPDIDIDTNNSFLPTVVTGPASYNVSLSDQLIMASASGGNVTMTLPLATASVQYIFKRTDSSANLMSIAPQGGQLLENSASPLALAALGRARIYSDGTAWWQV
jgi:hypothetical protein